MLQAILPLITTIWQNIAPYLIGFGVFKLAQNSIKTIGANLYKDILGTDYGFIILIVVSVILLVLYLPKEKAQSVQTSRLLVLLFIVSGTYLYVYHKNDLANIFNHKKDFYIEKKARANKIDASEIIATKNYKIGDWKAYGKCIKECLAENNISTAIQLLEGVQADVINKASSIINWAIAYKRYAFLEKLVAKKGINITHKECVSDDSLMSWFNLESYKWYTPLEYAIYCNDKKAEHIIRQGLVLRGFSYEYKP